MISLSENTGHGVIGYRLMNSPAQISAISEALKKHLCRMPLDSLLAYKIEVCMVEALNNILQHGRQIPETRHICLRVLFEATHIDVEIRDSAAAYSPPVITNHSLIEENGRGWFILTRWTNHLNYQRKGRINRLSMSFDI